MFPLKRFHRRRKDSSGFGRRRRRRGARVSGGGGARRKTGLTDGPHLSATEREKRAAAQTGPTWADWPGREKRKERGFGPAFGPKPKEDF